MDCPKRCDTDVVARIPDDPLVEIFSRVPAKSICRFKCVSKGWRDLIADPHHRKKLPQTLEGFFLMFDQEQCESDCGDDCDSDDGYGEDCSADGSDGEELPCQGCDGNDGEELRCQGYGFVDVLGTSVRPVDFSFLTELCSIKKSKLLHSCNGLLLFLVDCSSDISYIVCNPATEQYVSVPSSLYCSKTWDQIAYGAIQTYLLFDPGVSSHFHIVQFCHVYVYSSETHSWSWSHISVYVYSSETNAWSPNKCYQTIMPSSPNAYVNGMLHLIFCSRKDHLGAVDVEGNKKKIFPLPCHAQEDWGRPPLYEYVGQSHGCLHFICHERKKNFLHTEQSDHGLSIWVLQDYERQQWVLKDTISFLKLFGRKNFDQYNDYNYKVVGIHPDHSLVFLVQDWDRKLISYNMDSKEVHDLCTLGRGYKHITPYVPYFSKFGA